VATASASAPIGPCRYTASHTTCSLASRRASSRLDHLFRDALTLQLGGQVEKHLIGDLCERSAHSARSGELGDQHHGLLDDPVDE
jgi:hypothetical protein